MCHVLTFPDPTHQHKTMHCGQIEMRGMSAYSCGNLMEIQEMANHTKLQPSLPLHSIPAQNKMSGWDKIQTWKFCLGLGASLKMLLLDAPPSRDLKPLPLLAAAMAAALSLASWDGPLGPRPSV